MESEAVLRTLLERDPTLRETAEDVATALIAQPTVEEIADEVVDLVLGVPIETVYANSGKTGWGYVEPGEAATELLEEAVAPVIEDMKRRLDLGLAAAAETMCRGIVVGLRRAETTQGSEVLSWDPEFAAEGAGNAVEVLLGSIPEANRAGTGRRLLAALAADVPEWAEMLGRVVEPFVPTRRAPRAGR